MDTPDHMDTPGTTGPRRPLGARIADDLVRLVGGRRTGKAEELREELRQETAAARDAATRADEPPPGVRAPSRRDPVRTDPPLCGDPLHGHAPFWCAKYATEAGLRATLGQADEILDEELVELPRHVHRMIPVLVAEVEAELAAVVETVRHEGEDRTEIRRRAIPQETETIVDGAGNPIRSIRRPAPADEELDENLVAVRAQALQGLHARETIARLSGMSPEELADDVDEPFELQVGRIVGALAASPRLTIGGVEVDASIVDTMPDGLIVTIRPR